MSTFELNEREQKIHQIVVFGLCALGAYQSSEFFKKYAEFLAAGSNATSDVIFLVVGVVALVIFLFQALRTAKRNPKMFWAPFLAIVGLLVVSALPPAGMITKTREMILIQNRLSEQEKIYQLYRERYGSGYR